MSLMTVLDSMLIALLVREGEGKGSGVLGQLSQADTARAQRLFEAMKDSKSPVARMVQTANQINSERIFPTLDSNGRALLGRETKAQVLANTLRAIDRCESINALKAKQFQNLDALVSPDEMKHALRLAASPSEIVGETWAKATQRLGPDIAEIILREARELIHANSEIDRLEAEQIADLSPEESEQRAFADKQAETVRLLAATARRQTAFAELEKLKVEAKADQVRAVRIAELQKELA